MMKFRQRTKKTESTHLLVLREDGLDLDGPAGGERRARGDGRRGLVDGDGAAKEGGGERGSHCDLEKRCWCWSLRKAKVSAVKMKDL